MSFSPRGVTATGYRCRYVTVRWRTRQWEDIDTTLSDTGADLTPETAAADITVSDGGDTELASVSNDGKSFGLGWQDRLPTPTVDGDTASYALSGGETLQVTALPQGFSQNVLLDRAPDGPVSYRIPLELHGLRLSEADSGHLLTTGEPEERRPGQRGPAERLERRPSTVVVRRALRRRAS